MTNRFEESKATPQWEDFYGFGFWSQQNLLEATKGQTIQIDARYQNKLNNDKKLN